MARRLARHRSQRFIAASGRFQMSPVAHARLVVGSMSAHTLADTVARWVRDGSLRVADGFVCDDGGRELCAADRRLGDKMLGALDSALLPDFYRDVANVLLHGQQSERAE
ncbi:hypothetical protein AMAG_20168 [Allomyces macrogynus ATCC 38327]|uniref:Uncharacterized protein n=1 Tax=Allomyces macrogynus (strain ATCC 38327) TaxID=578462 RepID=A0A0L0T7S7_ALLM3|nr:hypothetical protein AMAG_20168 [Allomyces macrogynus ATCC 38327]|eukprot:KNE70751.1 hypothetical protein AMAG_20168 [Allomyces macrogynus ATCC 38327]